MPYNVEKPEIRNESIAKVHRYSLSKGNLDSLAKGETISFFDGHGRYATLRTNELPSNSTIKQYNATSIGFEMPKGQLALLQRGIPFTVKGSIDIKFELTE
jgi:hypothetical protein